MLIRMFPYCRVSAVLCLVLLLTDCFAPAQSAQSAEQFVFPTHPRNILIIDPVRDEIVEQIQTKGRLPKELIPSPDGVHVYVTSEARHYIEVINLTTRKVEDTIELATPGTRLNIFGLAVSRKGDRLFAHVKQIKLLPDEFKVLPPEIWSIDIRTHEHKKILQMPEGVVALLAPKDENRLVVWGRDIYYIDLAQGRIVDTVPLATRNTPSQGPVDTLPFFIQYEQSGILSVPYYSHDPITNKDVFGMANLDVDSGKFELIELGTPIPLYSSVVSPDRKRAYMVMNQLVVVDLEQRKIIAVRDLERTKYVANITRDGKKLYLPSAGAFVDVYDTASLKLIKRFPMPGDPSVSLLRAVPVAAAH